MEADLQLLASNNGESESPPEVPPSQTSAEIPPENPPEVNPNPAPEVPPAPRSEISDTHEQY